MGLIRTGIQMAGGYAIAKNVTSSLEKHDREKTARMQQYGPPREFYGPPEGQGYPNRNMYGEYPPYQQGEYYYQRQGPPGDDRYPPMREIGGPESTPQKSPYQSYYQPSGQYGPYRDGPSQRPQDEKKSSQGQSWAMDPPPYEKR